MRTPLIFLGPSGVGDFQMFESVANVLSYVEPVDVVAGEYGDHGWDADGKPIALVAIPSNRQPGLLGRLFGVPPALEVALRELEIPAEPEMLREALIGRLAGLQPDLVMVADDMALDDLIALVRGSIRDRLEQIRKGRYPKR